jgi:hypothetical protein
MEWLATWLKSLTFTNVAIIALIAMVAIPVYATYKLMTDPDMLNRFLSSYDEYTEVETGCTVRTVRLRGGPWRWSISTGFAYQGSDRWTVAVILQTEPTPTDVESYCAALGLIVDKMLGIDHSDNTRSSSPRREAGRRVQRYAMQSTQANEGGYPRHLYKEIPGATATSATEQGE